MRSARQRGVLGAVRRLCPLRPPHLVRLVRRSRGMAAALHARRKELFWWWIAYQSIKGTMTTAIVWLPALAYWFA